MLSKEIAIRHITIISLLILLSIAVFSLSKGWYDGHFDSVDTLREYIDNYGALGPLILASIQMLLSILPVIPNFMGCIVGATLFDAMGGFWINYIGISAGSIIAFFLARTFGIKLVSKMVSIEKHNSYIERISQSNSYATVLLAAIILPLAPDNVLCYFSGLVKMPVRKFIAIIVLGKPWCILFYSLFFSHLIS